MMKCYECGKPIRNEKRKVMKEVRLFRWSATPVPFHKNCWEKRRVSEEKRRYAKTFVESLIVLVAALIVAYVMV